MKEDKTKFLCPYCGDTFESYETIKSHAVKAHTGEAAPVKEGMIRLKVNGSIFVIQVQPEWTLNYLIHDVMGLTSPKMFCDRGACGSCTVIMDGRPILSCMTLAIECDGKSVQTAEGVANENHPLIHAYAEHHAMQCGYCTPGFVTTAKALLDKNPDPSLEEIQEALGGNLCRCGTYPQHPKAIMQAAKELQVKEKGGHNG
jgi:aerobic-type carbon monoxide dehydrogenase small subunit (CoxS/CutS family)